MGRARTVAMASVVRMTVSSSSSPRSATSRRWRWRQAGGGGVVTAGAARPPRRPPARAGRGAPPRVPVDRGGSPRGGGDAAPLDAHEREAGGAAVLLDDLVADAYERPTHLAGGPELARGHGGPSP